MKKTTISLLIFASFALCSVAQVYPKIPLGDDMYFFADDTESVVLLVEVDNSLYNRIYSSSGYRAALQEVTNRIYQKFNDDFDHIFYVLDNNSSGNTGIAGVNMPVSNSVRGIGRDIFSEAGSWGSSGKLISVCYFPDHSELIGVGPHELCHDYAAYIPVTYNYNNDQSYGGHWGVCNAGGMMGGFKYARKVEDNTGGVAGRTKYEGSYSQALLDDGSFRWPDIGRYLSATKRYSDIELYLMGMKSAQELRDAGFRFDVYSGTGYIADGYFYATRVTSYTIDNVISTYGARTPDAASSKKQFKALSVVISQKTASTHFYDLIIKDIKFLGGPIDAVCRLNTYNFSQATYGRGSLVVNDIKKSLKQTVAIPSYLDVETTPLLFDYGELYDLPIWSNTVWTVSSSASWLTVSPSSDSGNGTITVSAATNTTSSERKATITISGTGVTTQTIDVTQDKQPNESWELSATMSATLTGEGVLTLTSTTYESIPDYNISSLDKLPPWVYHKDKIRSVALGSMIVNSLLFYRSNYYGWDSVTSYHADADNPAFTTEEGVLYDKGKKILVAYPKSKQGEFTIPASVSIIERQGFQGCVNLTSVVIPNSVTSIGYMTFYGCTNLTSVVIPNSVTSIGDHAFRDCLNLTTIIIPNSVTSIGPYAFYHCNNLSSAVISNSVTTIESMTFASCNNLTSVVLPNSVTSIGDMAFSSCPLTSVVLPESLTTISDRAFECEFLNDITVEWTTPLAINHSNLGIFHSWTFKDNILRVPTGTKALYEKAEVWKDFSRIVEYSPTGNDEVHELVDAPGLQAYASNGVLHINGLHPGESFAVYNLYGQLIYKGMATSTEAQFALRVQGVHIVIATGSQSARTAKVILN